MKVLIIEDNREIATFIGKGLQFENFLVDYAEDGIGALEKISQNIYDILIVDLLLPKMDGMEFLKKIRDEGVPTPVIVLSAILDSDTKVKILNMGADDYMQKPFSFSELRARIRAVLRRTKSHSKSDILQVGDLQLDVSHREVTRRGKSIRLRKKEFDLLEYLARHQGEVVSQTVIIESVWDFNAGSVSNTLGSHVSSLRKKIDEPFPRKMLKTIHGVGYKLSP
jgi:two-component system, OmpR family, response regulator